ncbi:MAG: hypothetical protein IPI39_24390 [Candidatus Obscuribacter sp.]|nr:hypothetical protein [Candidatus Obscuribacter sp.]MBK7840859.1 hypothetical protein [Candidatus Obscuribacter sp.]MBK9621077.1 hypothetical protein [Candidatus Obscuribacter sp.]
MNNLKLLVVAGCLAVVPLVTAGGATAVLADEPRTSITPGDAQTLFKARQPELFRDSWTNNKHSDFDVLMPVPEQAMTNSVTGTRIYRCSNKGNNFIVSVSNPGVQKDSYKRFLQGIEQGLKTRGGKIIAAAPAKGVGWTGTLLQAEFKDNAKNTTLVAMADGVPVIYTLGVNLPLMDTDSQKFIYSLVVHPAQAALLPVKRPESDQEDKDSTYEITIGKDKLDELSNEDQSQIENDLARGGYSGRRGKGFLDATSIAIIMPTFVLLLLAIRFVSKIGKKKKS